MDLRVDLLAYNDLLEHRALERVTLVVFHCTELPTLALAREYAERVLYPSGTGNSGHLYVDRDGAVIQYVSLDRVAHHVRNENHHTVGIEVVNTGRYPHWGRTDGQAMTEPYTEAQHAACEALLGWLAEQLPRLEGLARHSELDTARVPAEDDPSRTVARKVDPGPRFDWERMQRCWRALQTE